MVSLYDTRVTVPAVKPTYMYNIASSTHHQIFVFYIKRLKFIEAISESLFHTRITYFKEKYIMIHCFRLHFCFAVHQIAMNKIIKNYQ